MCHTFKNILQWYFIVIHFLHNFYNFSMIDFLYNLLYLYVFKTTLC